MGLAARTKLTLVSSRAGFSSSGPRTSVMSPTQALASTPTIKTRAALKPATARPIRAGDPWETRARTESDIRPPPRGPQDLPVSARGRFRTQPELALRPSRRAVIADVEQRTVDGSQRPRRRRAH